MKVLLKQKGQALVEFAITIPFFVILVVFVFYTVLTLYDYFTIQELAREAARQRSVHNTAELSDAQLFNHLEGYGVLSDTYEFSVRDYAHFSIEEDAGKDGQETNLGTFVEIKAEANRKAKNGLLGIIDFPPKRLTYVVRMRREW